MSKKSKTGNRKKGAPSSLLHFTSVDSFFKMMEPSLNHLGEVPFITFHASHYAQMNDKNEGRIIASRFFRSQHEAYSEWEKKNGTAFIISFIASREGVMEYNIPMWLNYGCQGQGLCLRFDTQEIKTYTKSLLEFDACNYLSKKEATDKIKQLQKKESEVSEDDFRREVVKTVHFSKDKYWEYEEEYRIIKFEHRDKVMQKSTSRGIVEYVPIEIPLDILKGICIGPIADYERVKYSLETLLSYRIKHKAKINITQSHLQLQ